MEDPQEAFLKCYDEQADALFRFCTFKVNDRELAKDLVQDTFMKTWEYIAAGNKVENVKAFLYKTLNHAIIDYYRRKKSVSLESLQEEGFDASVDESSSIEASIDGRRARELVQKLPPPYRDAVYMRFVNELSLKEIAEITGEAENTIAVHVHRGLKKLKELYQDQTV